MKHFKLWLMLFSAMLIAAKGYSTRYTIPLQVQPNTCLTDSSAAGYSLDSVTIINNPRHGTVTGTSRSFTYCPTGGFTGTDSMLIYACIGNNGLFIGCDTISVIFTVQVTCNMSVMLRSDTAVCPGGGSRFDAIAAGGTTPYSYLWSDATTGLSTCQVNASTPLCVTVTDANVCSATVCSGTGISNRYLSYTLQVQRDSCVTEVAVGGFSLDSISLFSHPLHGTISGNDTTFTYCPDSGFIGSDSMLVFACIVANGAIFSCDTFNIIFNVSNHALCTLSASLIADTGTCAGGGRQFTVLPVNGTTPYAYLWSDNTTGNTDCEPNAGQGICVTVTDANGCTAIACSPYGGCSFSVSVYPDSTVCPGPLGLNTSVTGGTAPYSYYWSNNASTASICPAWSGSYCVTMLDANGCSALGCYTISATGNCSFQYSQPNLNSPVINFTAAFDSSYSLSSYSWDFGDGSPGNALNPIHTYATCGVYQVVMNLHYTTGHSCSYYQYVYVYCDSVNGWYPSCQANFNSYVGNDTVFFTDNSVYSPRSWSWDFGDGTTSTLQNPFHVYSTTGTWNVCLTIADTGTCSSTYCQQVSNTPVQDMEAYLYHGSTVTPGYPLYVFVGGYNAGNGMRSGISVYKYPAGTTFVTSTPAPTTIDAANHRLLFDYNSVLPGIFTYAIVELAADSTLVLASLVYDTLWVTPLNGDATPLNNVSTIIDSVVASWDPNSKSVSPKGLGEAGEISAATQEISYIIHFQNTGSAPARQVVVRDVISSDIDISSVTVVGASHEHVSQIIGNQLLVSFSHINLPDSGANFTASQGYIAIRARLRPSLPAGTRILNTANIYFDSNAPVVTNTVINTIAGNATGIAAIGNLEFALLPNPASTEVTIRGEFETGSTYELVDLLGERLQQGKISLTGSRINVAELSAGIYLVKVKSGERTGVQRLVVVR